jgi:spore maturation protein CgeB
MKILLVLPSHLKTVPMNHFSAKALSDLGHKVVVESYHASFLDKVLNKIRTVLPPPPQHWDNVNHRIQNTIGNFKPDLLFTIYGVKLSAETLRIAKSAGIKTACWWINDPFQFERGLAMAGNYDVWFSNSAECAKQITLKTGVKAYFLPTACNPDTHKQRFCL